MELHTERLVLRDFLPTDAPAVFAYQSKPEYLRHYRKPAPAEQDVRAFVDMLCGWASEEPRTKYQLAVTLAGTVIGTCGVRLEAPGGSEAEYGCELNPAFWEQGYAREASQAILTFGQELLRLQRFHATTSPENKAAIRLAEGLGFRRTAAGRYEAEAPLRFTPPER